METTLCSSCSFSVTYAPRHQLHPKRCSAVAANGGGLRGDGNRATGLFGRRCALASSLSLVSGMVLGSPGDGSAVTQGLLAGRIPGLSEPDENDIEGEAEIEMIGPPDKVISAFGPEVIGENVEGKVLSMEVAEHSGRKYYQFELEPPHVLITATAAGNRLYLFNVTGSGLQWKRHYKDLKQIADSFRVV